MKKSLKKLFLEINRKIENTPIEFYWDYNENLQEHQKSLIIEGKSNEVADEILEQNWVYVDSLRSEKLNELLVDYIDQFRKILKNPDLEIEELIEEYDDEFELYFPVDVNLKDLCKKETARVRLTLYSNYDCINSHWFESQSGFQYRESYFGAVVDFLKLNPAAVKKMLVEKNEKVHGSWPNKKYREGKELISLEELYTEMINSSSPANLFSVFGKINVSDMIYKEKITTIKFPKGTYMGFYSSIYGGGSCLDAMLSKDVVFKIGQYGPSEYDSLGIEVDELFGEGYCTDQVYGLVDSFYKQGTITN